MDAHEILQDADCCEEILNRVEDPKDLWSCSEAFPIFQEILSRKQNEFKFGLILPHIMGHLTDQCCKPLLNCRLVCKSWRKWLDKFEKDPYLSVFARAFEFNSGERTEQFLQMFASHDGNPFRGRWVTLHLPSLLLLAESQTDGLNEQENPASFHVRKLCQLLERFGNKMRNVLLQINHHNEPLAFCKNLQTILHHLPNLRKFGVWNDDVELEQLGETAELTAYIAANPLPVLPLLETLEISDVPSVMRRLILEKYVSKLIFLSVGDATGFPELGLRLCSLEMLSLERLDARASLLGLRQLHSLKWLRLDITHNGNQVVVWPIDELFRNIKHLPIQHLVIRSNNGNVFVGESGPVSADCRAHHESMTTVSLYLSDGRVSLNFLLYCPKLKSLFMFRALPRQGVPAGHPYGVTELLDVNELVEQVGHDLYKSNIWEVLPNLKFFNLWYFTPANSSGWDIFRRAAYEKRKLKNGKKNVAEEDSLPQSE